MSSNIFLAPYSIRLKDTVSGNYVSLGNKQEWGNDLFELLYSYLKNDMPCIPFDPEDSSKRTIRLETCIKQERTIYGIVKSGEYGLQSELHDVESNMSSYERQFTDAELIPYFFLVKMPPMTMQGILILQKLGSRGCKGAFEKDFNEYIKSKFASQYLVEISSLVPKDLVKAYLRRRIIKIKLIKHSFPNEVSDVDLRGLPTDEQGEVEYILKARRNKTLPESLVDKFRGNVDTFLGGGSTPVGSLLEIQGFEADNVKVEVQVGSSCRTIDLSNVDRVRFTEDITERVRIDTESGRPILDDIKKIATEFLEDLSSAIWGEVSDEKSAS